MLYCLELFDEFRVAGKLADRCEVRVRSQLGKVVVASANGRAKCIDGLVSFSQYSESTGEIVQVGRNQQ